jgi:hypothetical protein
MNSSLRHSWTLFGLLALSACARPAPPKSLADADAVSDSPAAIQSKELAPQATGVAAQLLEDAHALEKNGQVDEAGVLAEEAIAAYEEAFALARAARADARIDSSKQALTAESVRLTELEAAQVRAASEADAFELRARVALDKEPVVDVESMTPERARARRQAAIQLASEAHLLCVAAVLLGRKGEAVDRIQKDLGTLEHDLGVGSVEANVYPRATAARSACLTELTLTRRPRAQAAPEAAGSDQLLTDLAATNALFAFRDDRGVVVNLRAPTGRDGQLTEGARTVVELLARTSKQHSAYPLLVVGHSATAADAKTAEASAEAVSKALGEYGATVKAVEFVGPKQPVVDPRVSGAGGHNSRVEVIFVTVGR